MLNKKSFVAVATVISFLALGGTAKAADTSDATLIAMAKSLVRDQLRDPRSAEYQSIRVNRMGRGGPVAVCGEVNGNNAYGGKSGFHAFVVPFENSGKPFAKGDMVFDGVRLNNPRPGSTAANVIEGFCSPPKPD